MTKFIFIDDEGSFMLVEGVSYKEFREAYDSLSEEINALGEDFNFFYEELETRLSRNFNKNIKINGIEYFNY